MSILTNENAQWNDLQFLRSNFLLTGGALHNYQKKINSQVRFLIESLLDETLKITTDDFRLFSLDVRKYANDKISERWFDSTFDRNLDEDELKTLLEISDDNEIAMLLVGLRYWTVDAEAGTISLSSDRTVMSKDENEFVLVEKIIELIDSGDFDRIVTEIVGEIIQDSYKFSDFERGVAKRINDRIRDTKTTYGGGFLDDQYDYYIGLEKDVDSTGTQGVYRLSKNIYEDEPTTIPIGLLLEEERLGFEFPAAVQYPSAIISRPYGDAEGTPAAAAQDAAEAELQNFTELLDSTISDYPFVYQKDERPTTSSFRSIDLTVNINTNPFYKTFRNAVKAEKTPNQVIKENVLFLYQQFISKVILDAENGDSLDSTIGEHFSNAINADNFANNQIFELIYFEKIIAAKKELFDSLAKAAKEGEEGEGIITPEEREQAYRDQLDTFKTGKGKDVVDPPSEEDIQNRQRFFKQCALMLNMPKLRDVYQEKLNQQYSGSLPYHGRFTTIRSDIGEQETMLSSLVSSAKEQKLFELETHKISRLVPKVRLFKVFSDGSKEREVEFIFDRTATTNRPLVKNSPATRFMDVEFDKGTGAGLKSFSFEFNGTNPAEARNDITASLSLFFQSFTDFTRDRVGSNGVYKFVDLVIQPTPDENGQYDGIDIQSDRQYEPQFYRIRAEVGYVVPTDIDQSGINGFTSAERDAIRTSNKSFFLNMVDHDISFGKDGTVEIKISYRAYLESLLKHPRLDALASPELIGKRIQNAKELSTQLRNRNCTVEQIKELQTSLAAQERVLIKQSLSSIINRLKDREVIYTTTINKSDKNFFLKKGYFQKCDFDTDIEDGSEGTDVKLVLNSGLPESSSDFDFMDSANRSVQFFYFGDLLYTILDCVYSVNNTVRQGTGFDRNSVLLGSFEFEPFQSSSILDKVYNIADIPISIDFFSRWFVDNVVSQKSTRKTFPVMNFIRSLSNHLIKPSLIENCINRKLETRLRFQTTQITAHQEGGTNPLKGAYNLPEKGRNPISLEASELRTSGITPFNGGPVNDANSNFKDFHTFIVVSAIGSTLSYSGNGSYKEDINNGRFHVHIGQNAGMVKTLSLSKSDQQYIREARFFQNGIDGLLQLSAVYVANIEMFGNTLFYPGMEIFFNPYGIGGSAFDPRKRNSIANKLGIGGYHTITSVKSSISPGKFTTSISAQQYYSGDGSGNPNVVKQRNSAKKATSIDAYEPSDSGNPEAYKKCKSVILNAQDYKYTTETVTPPIEEPIYESGEASGEATESRTEAVNTPTAEEAYGDARIQNRSITSMNLDGQMREATVTLYKDGSTKTTYIDEDNEEVEVLRG